MKNMKSICCVIASVLMCVSIASCGQKKSSTDKKNETETTTEATTKANTIEMFAEKDPDAATKAPEEEKETEPAPAFDNAVAARSGDAFLAVNDSNWWIQYWGDKSDPLCYDAGVVHITGDGEYTVSVTTDTDGYRYATTQDTTDQLTPSGIGFAAVIIKDGATVLPDAVITIKDVKVNGESVELTKKNYTNTEEGNIRSNIFNEWVSDDALPSDAKSADGALYDGGNPTEINDGSYSAQIVNGSDFSNWKDIVVTFEVKGAGTL